MAWFDEAVFYHIYPLGLTGAPKENNYSVPSSRLKDIKPVIDHIKAIGCNALYIGPLFESVGHGYETTDYKKTDSRLGTNEDLKDFVSTCHKKGIRVIFDGVFNHTGRDFFAFRDILEKRENSPYKDWYSINFWGNNSYNDGFSYANWGGYDLLIKLNQKNPAVIDYFCDIIRFWVKEFDIDGIRLDAADVLDFDFMKRLRTAADEIKQDFFLLGEVIHGDYNRWVNKDTLHSVTNYVLHKALYSGHNDRNYFEIAHTVKRLQDMGIRDNLYNFSDNHDVERIYTKLSDKNHFIPLHILLYTLPGIPSVYYGSELGIEGRKEKHSDASLRPAIAMDMLKESETQNALTLFISALGRIRQGSRALAYGEYKERCLKNRQYAFTREFQNETVVITVNNDSAESTIRFSGLKDGVYKGLLWGKEALCTNGSFTVTISGNGGEIWVNADRCEVTEHLKKELVITVSSEAKDKKEDTAKIPDNNKAIEAEKSKKTTEAEKAIEEAEADTADKAAEEIKNTEIPDKPYEEMTVKELQAVILKKMEANGFVTDRMRQDVYENVYHNSLVTWAKSFR